MIGTGVMNMYTKMRMRMMSNMSKDEKIKFYENLNKTLDVFFKPKKNLISLDSGKDYIKDTIKNYHLSE